MSLPISRRTLNLGLAAGAAAAALPSTAAAQTDATQTAAGPPETPPGRGTAAAPFFAETTLWDNTVDPLASYFVYGLCALPNDTLIACTEGRHEVCDAGPHDLLIRRSVDRGQTWTPTYAVEPSVNGQS
jgi:hypothetical protein